MTLDRNRLSRLLALLASPFEGERLAAATKVVETLDRAGMRPEELAKPAPNPFRLIDLGSGMRIAELEVMLGRERERANRAEFEARRAESVSKEAAQKIATLSEQLEAALPPFDYRTTVERFARSRTAVYRAIWRGHLYAARVGQLRAGAKLEIQKMAAVEEASLRRRVDEAARRRTEALERRAAERARRRAAGDGSRRKTRVP